MVAHSNMLMIDFETLGTRESAVILSVGLVYFSFQDVGPQLYLTFSLEEQLLKGRTIDDATVNWWIKDKERKRELENLLCSMHGSDLDDIQLTLAEMDKPSLIWSRGCMDFHILNNILGPEHSFPFYVHRDVRTLDVLWKPSDVPTHNALADAQLQVKQVQEVQRRWKNGMKEQCAQTVTEISKKMEPAPSVGTVSSCNSGCSGSLRRTHP
jgi:hypothetical protein